MHMGTFMHLYVSARLNSIPYCPNFSWDFIFANFANGFGFTKFYAGILAWSGFLDCNNVHTFVKIKTQTVNCQVICEICILRIFHTVQYVCIYMQCISYVYHVCVCVCVCVCACSYV